MAGDRLAVGRAGDHRGAETENAGWSWPLVSPRSSRRKVRKRFRFRRMREGARNSESNCQPRLQPEASSVASLAHLARRRIQSRPAPLAPPEALQAKVDFFEALVGRDQGRARAAWSVLDKYRRPERPLTPEELAKRQRRTRALVRYLSHDSGIRRPRPCDLHGLLA